jgi:hypothetical protein
MNTVVKNKPKQHQYKIRPAEKRVIDRAAKKIVKKYGKTIKLLASE